MKSSKYKALILNVDGTLVDGHDAIPSKRLINAIKKPEIFSSDDLKRMEQPQTLK